MSDSSGNTPDWLRQHTETPSKIFICNSSSDDDDIPLVRRAILAPGNAGSGAGTSAPAPTPQPAQGPSQSGPQPTEQQPGPGPTDVQHLAQLQTQTQDLPAAETQNTLDTQAGARAPQRSEEQDVPATQEPPYGHVPIALSQMSEPPPSSAKRPSQQLRPVAGLAVHAAGSQLPIMMPEKLNRNKVLLELPYVAGSGDGHCHGAADLSGDSGAVGRIVVLTAAVHGGKGGAGASAAGGDGRSCELQIDLKGVVYNAWVLPLAGTAMVLNIQPSEAKVESLFNDFVRLREAADPYEADEDGDDDRLAYLLDGDDENYQIEGGDGDEAAGAAPARGTAKAAKGAKAAKAAKQTGKKAAAGAAAGRAATGDKNKKKAAGKKPSGGKPLGVKGGGVTKKKAAVTGSAAAAASKKKKAEGAAKAAKPAKPAAKGNGGGSK